MPSNASINIDGNTLTVSITGETTKPQKIFVKPSDDYGDFSKHRKSSAHEDYLTVLREEKLAITRLNVVDNVLFETTYTFKFGEGDNYSNGFYLLTDTSDSKPLVIDDGEVVTYTIQYTGSKPLRIAFGVY